MPISLASNRIAKALGRRAARWSFRKPAAMRLDQPLVSFTFDDFPRSALFTGGRLLENSHAAGTYYASFGLMGKTAPTGEIFSVEDLPTLFRGGHELACHTFDHLSAWETPSRKYIAAVERNLQALVHFTTQQKFRSHSFPISFPRPTTKRWLNTRFATCRGGGQKLNLNYLDLGYLNSFFIEQSRNDTNSIHQIIKENAQRIGWLIFSTHDVSDSPTPYGCTTALFSRIIEWTVASGAQIATVSDAMARIHTTG